MNETDLNESILEKEEVSSLEIHSQRRIRNEKQIEELDQDLIASDPSFHQQAHHPSTVKGHAATN